MTEDNMSVVTTIAAPIETVFDVLADTSTHEAIDGTGWVRKSLDGTHLTGAGQLFRMAMYHENHPAKDYEMANRVEVFDRPNAIAWQPGSGPDGAMTSASTRDADIEYGGWIWRYDLKPEGSVQTAVTLTYDWSGVPTESREHIQFPPFEAPHLDNSLKNLAELAEGRLRMSSNRGGG
jgi:hypothetical protein